MAYDKVKNADHIFFFTALNNRHLRFHRDNLTKRLRVPFEFVTELNSSTIVHLQQNSLKADFKILIVDCVNTFDSIDYLKPLLSSKVIYCPLIEVFAELGWGLGITPVFKEQEYVRRRLLSDYETLAQNFTDKKSKLVLDAKNNYSLTFDNVPVLKLAESREHEYFNMHDPTASLLLRENEVYVDVGAWIGDTVTKFTNMRTDYNHIYAFEPSKRNFDELITNCAKISNLTSYNLALGASRDTVRFLESTFHTSGSRVINEETTFLGATNQRCTDVDCAAMDDLNISPTLIKMDVEGYEAQVLLGARETIKKHKPNLAITCYHFPQDIFEIMETVLSICTYDNIALRHYSNAMNDYVLLFSDCQKF